MMCATQTGHAQEAAQPSLDAVPVGVRDFADLTEEELDAMMDAEEAKRETQMDTRWTALKNSVKSWVSETFEAPEGGSWRNGWEFYAVMTEMGDSFHTGLIERDIVDPACENLCGELGEVELTALLSWLWAEYTEGYNPGVKYPWQMDMQSRRKALSVVLNKHMLIEANSDGADVEER